AGDYTHPSCCALILGIDPGVSGALALLNERGCVVGVADMPVLAAGTKGRRLIDVPALIRLLQSVADRARGVRAVLEEVSAMPRDGAVGAFSFGRGFGSVETALAGSGIPVTMVRPQVWKRRLGVPAGSDSKKADAVRLIASRLMPSGAEFWP